MNPSKGSQFFLRYTNFLLYYRGSLLMVSTSLDKRDCIAELRFSAIWILCCISVMAFCSFWMLNVSVIVGVASGEMCVWLFVAQLFSLLQSLVSLVHSHSTQYAIFEIETKNNLKNRGIKNEIHIQLSRKSTICALTLQSGRFCLWMRVRSNSERVN